ncbi:hypothetical protein PCL_06448 [Purpureocillium lilacinum]|uniref:Uncharacterized protein n=1 Tax=Purpureocillium lilacinum TaxID=33203 RepID=A0A2U3EMW4_PURLI|nr:hypothetical protein Purlil1_3923 [Purpureocillium lilacinum]PWI75790.1 hypothetical protein PCL_06448 [Purpureocillium lilacinum]
MGCEAVAGRAGSRPAIVAPLEAPAAATWVKSSAPVADKTQSHPGGCGVRCSIDDTDDPTGTSARNLASGRLLKDVKYVASATRHPSSWGRGSRWRTAAGQGWRGHRVGCDPLIRLDRRQRGRRRRRRRQQQQQEH